METPCGSGHDALQGPNTRSKSQSKNPGEVGASKSSNNSNTTSGSINTPKNNNINNHAGQSILIDNTLKTLCGLLAPVLKSGMEQRVNQLLRDIKSAFLSLEEKLNQFMLNEQRYEAINVTFERYARSNKQQQRHLNEMYSI